VRSGADPELLNERPLLPHQRALESEPQAASGTKTKSAATAKKLLDRLVGRAYISLPPRRSFVVLPNRSDVVGCFGGLIGCSFDKLDDVKRGCAGGVRVVCASSEERG